MAVGKSKKSIPLHSLMWACPIASFVALVISLTAYCDTPFPNAPSHDEVPFQCGLATESIAVPTVWLATAVFRIREPDGENNWRRTGLIVAGVTLIFGAATSGGAFVRAVSVEINNSILSSQDLTPAETVYTPLELNAETEAVLFDSGSVFVEALPTGDDMFIYAESCRISDLPYGTYCAGVVTVPAVASDDDFRRVVIEKWGNGPGGCVINGIP